MPRLKAKRILDDARLGKVQLSADSWYDITMLATGDEQAASRCFKEFVRACHRAGREPS